MKSTNKRPGETRSQVSLGYSAYAACEHIAQCEGLRWQPSAGGTGCPKDQEGKEWRKGKGAAPGRKHIFLGMRTGRDRAGLGRSSTSRKKNCIGVQIERKSSPGCWGPQFPAL